MATLTTTTKMKDYKEAVGFTIAIAIVYLLYLVQKMLEHRHETRENQRLFLTKEQRDKVITDRLRKNGTP